MTHTPEEIRILRAMGQMPYGALVHAPAIDTPTLENIGAYLEALAEVLDRVAKDDQKRDARLYQLEQAVGSVRWLLSPESAPGNVA